MNPASAKWAIRITTGVEDEHKFAGLENMCAIHHTGGRRAGKGFKEKSHYHIFYEGDEVRYNSLKDLFKDRLFNVKGNAQYSMKPWDTTFQDWWEYVWREDEKAPRVVLWTLPFEQPPVEYGIPIVADLQSPTMVIQINDEKLVKKHCDRKTSLDKQKKFLQYCIDHNCEGKVEVVLELLYSYMRDISGFMLENATYVYVNFVIANLRKNTPEDRISIDVWKRRMLDKYF